MATLLALDVGERKIGVAVGDTATRFAFPRAAILVQDWEECWEPLSALLKELNVSQIIVGLPLNDDGSVGAQADRIRAFIAEAEQRFGLPVIGRDERHSSVAVQREQRAAGQTMARGEEDSLAAQLILESYLQTL